MFEKEKRIAYLCIEFLGITTFTCQSMVSKMLKLSNEQNLYSSGFKTLIELKKYRIKSESQRVKFINKKNLIC